MRIKHDGSVVIVRHEGRIGKDPHRPESPRARKPDFHELQL
jgi:hypothetical protein